MFKKVIKKALQLSILCILSACAIGSSIKETDTLQQAQEELQKADDKTLVVFDVDGVLTYDPDDRLLVEVYKPEDVAKEDAAFLRQAQAVYAKYIKSKERNHLADMFNSGLLKSKDHFVEADSWRSS